MSRRRLVVTVLLALLGVSGASARSRPQQFTASAFSLKGPTADGARARKGAIAADPAVLPLGTRVRIRGAGRYSGVYTVADTGSKIVGRHIDIFVRTEAEAKRFGRKNVTVQVLQPH